MLRRVTYHGWPVADDESYRTGSREFFRSNGVKKIYFINAFEGDLIRQGIQPREIKDPRGNVAFRVYELNL